ncbi:DUF4040 domain-containing protein [bacterium 3DAC]|jgi:uncharacterized MnhB-related membrane protein|nr:DUF4040 domain-containing protein [Dictyoglomota bacterium]UZN22563.1 DUF4040 domain-containing protein [bacterium 3DAC]
MTVVNFLIYVLMGLMVVMAIIAAETKNLLSAAIFSGFISLVVSMLFVYLQAPDVAMAEAAIGAALSLAIILFAIKRTGEVEEK